MDTASPEDLPPSPALATLQLLGTAESLQRKGKRQNNPDRIWPTVQKKVCHFASEFSAVSYSSPCTRSTERFFNH